MLLFRRQEPGAPRGKSMLKYLPGWDPESRSGGQNSRGTDG